MASSSTPTAVRLWFVGLEAFRLGVEAQTVVNYRALGMMGFWPVAPTEARTMLVEKQRAFAKAASAAGSALAKGQFPDRVMAAAIRPLRARTTRNVHRLSRRGPARPSTTR